MKKPISLPYLFLLICLFDGTGQAEDLEANRKSCVNNLRMLEAAADQAAIENNLSAGAVIAQATITQYIRGGVDALKCPSGGRYTFGTVGKEPHCSIHGTASNPNARGRAAGVRQLWGREPETEREIATDRLLERMSQDQTDFKPEFLEDADPESLRALADRFFPQVAGNQEGMLTKSEVENLVAQLGAGDFQAREQATQRLKGVATPFRAEVRKAALGKDPELRRRAQAVLITWAAREETWPNIDFAQYEEGLRNTLAALREKADRSVLTRQAELALAAGPVNDGQKRLIDLCLPGTPAAEPEDR